MNESHIFLGALERPPADRAAYLEAACAGDACLRAGVEALLRAHETDPDFLEALPDTVAYGPPATVPAAAGLVIADRYTLVEPAGEGGMGSVWKAQQTGPVRREVAVKLIKLGMDTRQVLARFEAERQALALMDHPNIARVFDAGLTPDGRPFFAMELVDGVPITRYCDDRRVPVRDRLGLFVQVCQAVQHAHQKGVIHRDIKPTNVLVAEVDGRPLAKVIDFGVAKAVGDPLTEQTLQTGLGTLVGTPEYMSPEQATFGNPDVDTRSDVYALGALLYELLAGSPPAPRPGPGVPGLLEVLRSVREDEPPRPSARLAAAPDLSRIAADRGLGGRQLPGLVRGDLDWIVMTCLEKDRSRRYESAAAVAADVGRYLADAPVEARPPAAGYRLRKFVRRNRRSLATAAAVGLMLLVSLAAVAGSVGWAVRDRAARAAEADRERADRAADRGREADRALDEAVGHRDRGDWSRARTTLDRAEWFLAGDGTEAGHERVRAAAADLRTAERLEAARLGPPRNSLYPTDRGHQDPVYADAFRENGIDLDLVDAPTAAGLINAAAIRAHLVAALDDWLWARHSRVLNSQILPKLNPPLPEVKARYDRVLRVANLVDPDEWRRQVRDPAAHHGRAGLVALAGRAEVMDRPATAILLARFLERAGARDKAIAVLHAVRERRPDDFLVSYELALFLSIGPAQPGEAIGFLQAAVALRPGYPILHLKLGQLLERAGRLDQAIAEFRAAYALDPDNAYAYSELARALQRAGNWDEPTTLFARRAAAAAAGKVPPDPVASQAHLGAAQKYVQAGRWAEAIAAYREAIRWGPLPPMEPLCHGELAWLLAAGPEAGLRDPAAALRSARLAVGTNPKSWRAHRSLGAALYRTGDPTAAIAALKEGTGMPGGGDGPGWLVMAMAYHVTGNAEEAHRSYDAAGRWAAGRKQTTESPGAKAELDALWAEAATVLGLPPAPVPRPAPAKKSR